MSTRFKESNYCHLLCVPKYIDRLNGRNIIFDVEDCHLKAAMKSKGLSVFVSGRTKRWSETL